jgi:hypothetical protein
MTAIGICEYSDGGTILFPNCAHKKRLSPTATAAPTMVVKGALNEMGAIQAGTPSRGPVTAQIIRRIVRGDDDRRPDSEHSKRSAKHPEHLRSIQSCKTVRRAISRGYRTSERRMPRHPPSALASAARHRLRGPHIASSRAGRFNRMPLPVDVVRQQRAHTHRQQQEKAGAECAVHDLWRHWP